MFGEPQSLLDWQGPPSPSGAPLPPGGTTHAIPPLPPSPPASAKLPLSWTPPSLGEVVVCLPVAEAQALAAQRGVAGEVAHLVVHGLLHLLGYDHEESEEESARMKDREDALLAALGYEGAYEHGH